MKEQEPQHEHYLREHKDVEDISRLSEKLTPPEETVSKSGSDRAARDDGILVVDTGQLKIPHGFVENEQEKRGLFGLEPVIVVIMVLMIVFIAFIAYLVYLMPPK